MFSAVARRQTLEGKYSFVAGDASLNTNNSKKVFLSFIDMFDKIKKWFGESADSAGSDLSDSLAVSDTFAGLRQKMQGGKYEEVIAAAQPFLKSDNSSEVYEAKKLLGLAYFQMKDYARSQAFFEEICMTSDKTEDFFNLCTSTAMNGEYEKSHLALLEAVSLRGKLSDNTTISIPNMHFYYMHALRDMKQWERAYEELKWLGEIYRHLVITDSTFLYIRGVPFLQYTMEAGKEVLEHIAPEEAKAFIASLSEKVDDEGKDFIKEFQSKLQYGIRS